MKSLIVEMLCSLVVASPLLGQGAGNGPLLMLPEAKAHRLVLIDPRTKSAVGTISVPGWPRS